MARLSLRVPRQDQRAFAHFVMLESEDMAALVKALQSAPPCLSSKELATNIQQQVQIDPKRLRGLVGVVLGLFGAYSAADVSLADFVEDVIDLARRTLESDEAKKVDWGTLKKYLVKLFSLEDSLGVTSKALGVMIQNQHVYSEARVLSDIRAIFKPHSEEPVAAVIVHNLRIAYQEGEASREFYVAMDSNDLRDMKKHIDRAITKEAALRKSLDTTKSLKVLDVLSE